MLITPTIPSDSIQPRKFASLYPGDLKLGIMISIVANTQRRNKFGIS
jgi:hypothetical protein